MKISEIEAFIGRRICECRRSCGMTQKMLATRMGVAEQQIAKYEDGRVSVRRLFQIAEITDTDVCEFFPKRPGSEPAADGDVDDAQKKLAALPDQLRDALVDTIRAAAKETLNKP